jgi:hypothetical protein
VVRNPEPFQCGPRLPLGRDELALVFAHRALSRLSCAWRILRATRCANECRHDLPRSQVQETGLYRLKRVL